MSSRYPATIYLRAAQLEQLVFIVHYAMQSGLQVEARLTDNKEWAIQLTEQPPHQSSVQVFTSNATSRNPLSHKDLGQTGPAGFDVTPYGVTTQGKCHGKYHATKNYSRLAQKIIPKNFFLAIAKAYKGRYNTQIRRKND